MAAVDSSSSSSSRLWSYDVFPSFSGQDVRRTILSHILIEFQRKGIRTFMDNGIRRGDSLAPELMLGIRESRIAIVILSKNYASSSWCLNELLEIMDCKVTQGPEKIVMTVFHDVDPSDVRKQSGDFGRIFKQTCVEKAEDEKQRWKQALTDVANIVGLHSKKWDSEAEMVLKIATDVSNELNSTPSRDFDNFVGIEAHLANMISLLCLGNSEVRMMGIWGPAGIGKSTIARALYNRLSCNFQLTLFMDNVKEHYRRNGPDHSSKLQLQERFLAEILDHKDMRIDNLGAAEKRLKYQKVLIVLDDLDKIEQLNALADRAQWFGTGSRIIVTTEHKDLFETHGINHIYEVGFPSELEALHIFSQSAFKQISPPEEFVDLATEVAKLTRLPLGLSVLGSSLRGKNKSWWIRALPSLKTNLHEDIEKILKVGYDSLGHDKYKATFLHIACLFHGVKKDHVIQLLKSSGLDIELGFDVLVERALIYISNNQCIMMHHLLRQMGKEIVRRQSPLAPGKRQFLVDAKEIYDVLADNTGTETIVGISFNMSEIEEELFLGEGAFSGMRNLQFIKFYKNWSDNKARLHLDQGLKCLSLPRKLRLLHWEACPMTCLPLRFSPEYLVEIRMLGSKVEKLWEGSPRLGCLKRLYLSFSIHLEEVPDLSKATNLENLGLASCHSLITLPSSIRELKKLISLSLSNCSNLESLPENVTLESLTSLGIEKCKALKDFPEFSSKLKCLDLSFSAIREVPLSVQHWTRLEELNLRSCEQVTAFPPVPGTVSKLYLDHSGITEIPDWIENIWGLKILSMAYCKHLLDISPKISKLRRLYSLNFKGCSNVSQFPVEIFQSFCFEQKLSLNLEKINSTSLPRYTRKETHTFRLELFMKENDFDSIPVFFKRLSKLRALHVDDCRKLESLPDLPNSMEEVSANNCVSLVRIYGSSCSSHTPKLILKFINCSELDQETRKLLIDQWLCGYAILPGSQVPDYFTHQARGSSLTIQLDHMHLSGPLRFKACLVLPWDELTKFGCDIIQIWCSIRGNEGYIYEWPRIHLDPVHDPLVDHLVILNSYYTLEEGMVSDNKVVFNFRCYPAMIEQCGIKLLESCPCEHNIEGHPVVRVRPLNGWISFLYRRTFSDYGSDSSGECADSDADTESETEDGEDCGDGDLGKDNRTEGSNDSGDDDVDEEIGTKDGDGDTAGGTEDNEDLGISDSGEDNGTEENKELGVSDSGMRRNKKRKRSSSGKQHERPSKKMRIK